MHLQKTILNALRIALGICSGIIILDLAFAAANRPLQMHSLKIRVSLPLRLTLHKGADLLFHVLYFLVEHPGGHAQCAVAKDDDLLHAV